jgi:aryl-alcohol dehydrogenase-like predicted oxidoreductase
LHRAENSADYETMMKTKITRRKFLHQAAIGAAGIGVTTAMAPIKSFAKAAATASLPDKMPLRPLGQTGRNVGLFSLGGQGLLEIPGHTDEAVAIINRAIDLGVNYLDTSHYYGHGCSEQYYGEVLKTRRNEVYLATKSADRTYDGAMRELDESLKRLQTDHLDCWQMHNVRTQKDVDGIFADNGALKAFQKARDEKITSFIGVTGHRNPFMLKACVDRFPFDTILMALNAADKHLDGTENETSFIKNLLPVAVEKKMGIIGMKVPALGKIFQPGGIATMDQAMSYVLTLPVSTLIIGIKTIPELEENVRIAKNFMPLTSDEMAQLENLTQPYYAEATFFKRQRGY